MDFILSGYWDDVEPLVVGTLSASSWMMIFAGGMLTAAIISSVIVIANPRWPAMLGLGIIVIYHNTCSSLAMIGMHTL